MRKLSTVLMLGLALCMLALPIVAQDDDDYIDPEGLWTVPIPTNWTVTESDGYTTLTSPDDEIHWHMLAVENTGDDLETLIEQAWALADPDFAETAVDVTESDVPNDDVINTALTITYSIDPHVYQAIAFEADEYVFIWLVDADFATLQQRSAQVNIIQTGFDVLIRDDSGDADYTAEDARPIDDAMLAELEGFIERTLEASEVPALAVGIVQGDELIYSAGFGENVLGDPIDAQSLFMIGSNTKTMTTMMMGSLVDDGLLAWDTPVIEIMPDFAVGDDAITEIITVENLVCACTGVPRRDVELVFNQSELTAQDIITSLADFEFFTDFGEAFQYSNQMVATGGYIATLASTGEYDTIYDDYLSIMQNRIFDPIGMTKTTFDMELVATNGNYAQPYGLNLGDEYYPIELSLEEFVRASAPAGAAWSNVEDMAQYMTVILNHGTTPDGTQIIASETLDYIWQPQVPISATDSYGLGWILSDYNGLPQLSHGGNTLGFTSDMYFLPDLDLGIIVMNNARGSNVVTSAVWSRLLELIFDEDPVTEEQVAEVLDQSSEQLASINFIDLDADALAPYLGTFSNDALGEITLSLETDMLYMDAGDWVAEIRALRSNGEVFYVMYDMPLAGFDVAFALDADDNPTVIVGSSIVEYTFTVTE